jgi:hypothetical protein
MPWSSSGYLVVFSGATVETEAAYALGVNGFIPYSDSDFSSFIDMGRYEPNGTEQTAAVLTTDSMMAYLHKNDVDFYRYMVTCPENEPKFEGGSFLVPSSLSLDGSLAWLSENALEGGAYTVILNGDELIAPRTLSYGGKTVSITLLGGMAERTVSLGSSGPLFTVESGVTLKLGYNVTLRGQSNNTSSLVRVDSGGTLEMKSGSKISGNTATVASGGGVSVNGGMFTMSGGEISGNSAHSGGGVYVASGTFIKQSGGVIYGADANSVLKNTANTGYSYGHAVYVSGSQMRDFTVGMGESLDNTQSGAAGGWVEFMPGSLSLDESLVWLSANAVEGGAYTFTVSANESLAPRTLSYGGKTVSITLLGGTEERTVSLSSNGSLFTVGGGVTLKLGNKITLRGLSGNTSSLVRVESGGKLEMNSGSKISGNTSSSYYGGGVYVNGGTFTMSGGEISGNSASLGGGVSVSSGTFTKQSGGIIYGANASSTLKNTATGGYSYGHAVYVSGSQMRNFTVGTGVPLNSTQSGTAGGWAESMPDNLPLNESLAWLSAKATEGGAYTVTVSDSETIGPISLSYGGKTVSITLVGGTAERTVSLGSNGSLFTVGSGVTLKLGNNITLRGRSGNTSALVRVESGGKLEMNSGSKISGNANSSSSASTTGGGVYVAGGTFTMSGGEISGNTAATSGPSSATAYGGGVYVASGTFTMSDGEISGNTASATSYYSGGGGVYVASGSTFTMSGGTINGNKAVSSYHSSGGGVQVDGTFTMSNGTISGNNVSNRGGGVCVTNGTFTMNGGTISSNTATYDGGGVRLESGTFTMKQGAISGNTASSGGGVSVASGTFTKQSGGIIYGSDESSSLKNTASSDSYGHAVYVSSGSKKRNSTAGVGVTMDSMTTGTDGGWE